MLVDFGEVNEDLQTTTPMKTATLPAEPPPLSRDQDGVVRVGNTRIPLERIVFEWNSGASPEGIVESFPVLDLADVYGAIAYYLQHRGEVDAYVEEREAEAGRVQAEIERRFPPQHLRERLLARLNR